MAIKLVRESSETPNITNRDDARMIRYAYGGYNGVVKDYGNELDSIEPNDQDLFKIGSGRVVLQGWEVELDGAGWSLPDDKVTGRRYYTLYLEIQLSTEIATIKSTYSNGEYPEISVGDDLTSIPNGTARLVLYHVQTYGSRVVSYDKEVPTIPYGKEELDTIKERLDRLGFKDGSVTLTNGLTAAVNTVTRQGNYVIGKIEFSKWYTGSFATSQDYNLGTLPEEFRPKEKTNFGVSLLDLNFTVYQASQTGFQIHKTEINTDGSIVFGFISPSTVNEAGPYPPTLTIVFGFEAPAIN